MDTFLVPFASCDMCAGYVYYLKHGYMAKGESERINVDIHFSTVYMYVHIPATLVHSGMRESPNVLYTFPHDNIWDVGWFTCQDFVSMVMSEKVLNNT